MCSVMSSWRSCGGSNIDNNITNNSNTINNQLRSMLSRCPVNIAWSFKIFDGLRKSTQQLQHEHMGHTLKTSGQHASGDRMDNIITARAHTHTHMLH